LPSLEIEIDVASSMMPSVVVRRTGVPPFTLREYQRSHSSFGNGTGKTTWVSAHIMLLSEVNTVSRGTLCHTSFAAPVATSAIINCRLDPPAKVDV
jgi:hypothetical protein